MVITPPLCPASGTGQLKANPHVAGPRFSLAKPTQWMVAMMRSNHMVVGEEHLLEPSCQRYGWKTGRCGLIDFGSGPRKVKIPFSNFKPSLSCKNIPLWKRLLEITLRKSQE